MTRGNVAGKRDWKQKAGRIQMARKKRERKNRALRERKARENP